VADPYLLPGTDVLSNRWGITAAAVVADFEVRASLVGVAELERRSVDSDFDLQHLCAIHRRIFAMSTTGLARRVASRPRSWWRGC